MTLQGTEAQMDFCSAHSFPASAELPAPILHQLSHHVYCCCASTLAEIAGRTCCAERQQRTWGSWISLAFACLKVALLGISDVAGLTRCNVSAALRHQEQ